MIRYIRDCRPVARDSIGNTRRGVIEILRLDKDFTDTKKTFFQFGVMYATGQILKFHRKIGILHLTGKGILKTSLKCDGAIDVQLRSRKKGWGEEGKTLNVVPVGVRSEERRVGKECRSRWSP